MALPVCGFSIALIVVCITLMVVNLIDAAAHTKNIEPKLILTPISSFAIFEAGLRHLGFILSFTMPPLWAWLIWEYRDTEKIKFTRTWFMWIEPLIACSIICISMVFTLLSSEHELLTPTQRLGSYHAFHRYYMIIAGVSLLVWSVITIRSQGHRSMMTLMQFAACIATPMLLFLAYRDGFIDIPVGAPTLVLLLVWAARQSSLLDVIPFALSGVVDRVNAGIIVFNGKNDIVFCNDFAKHAFGMDEVRLNEEISTGIFSQQFDLIQRQFQTAQIDLDAEGQTNNKRYFDVQLQPLVNNTTGQFLGHIALMQDISERRLSQLALESANQKMQNLYQQKSDFFAGITHEFRTPLTLSLGGVSDLLGNADRLNTQDVQSLRSIENNNRRLLALVSQLLDLSELEASIPPVRPRKIVLEDYLPIVLANYDSQARLQNIQLSLDIKCDCTEICFDVNALDKVMFNLLSNAFKSIQHDGRVCVKVMRQNQDHLCVSVHDTGTGIPVDVLPNIFEPFYTHQLNHEFWPQGSGVGLSLVKQLLRINGADIRVESEYGIGSEFVVTLPCASHVECEDAAVSVNEYRPQELKSDGEFLAQFESKSASEITDGSKLDAEKLILIVEDNAEMRKYIRSHLGVGFRVLEAQDGEEALLIAKQTVPDLVLTDYMMPRMSGLELCGKLKSELATSHIPVIMLTARSSQRDKIESLEYGADDYLTKPFDVTELLLRIQNLMSTRDQLRLFYQQTNLESATNDQSREAIFLEKISDYIDAHLSDPDLRVADLASVVHLSERSLNRKVKALTDRTPKQWIVSVRLQQAAKLLLRDTSPITTVAYSVGFSESAYFSRAFKSYFKQTPAEYRKSQH